MGLQLENIVSRLSKKLEGRISHCIDSYEKIGTDWGHINKIKRGNKPSWIDKASRQWVAASNPTIVAKDSNVLNREVQKLLEKGVISMIGQVQGHYVSSYFAVPKSKRFPD